MLIHKIESIISNEVSTIGGKDIIPKLIGTVSCYWNDYQGQLQKNKFNNLL